VSRPSYNLFKDMTSDVRWVSTFRKEDVSPITGPICANMIKKVWTSLEVKLLYL